MGEEISGHYISGHIHTTAKVEEIVLTKNNFKLILEFEKKWMKYIFLKGYIAVNGASLTVAEIQDNLIIIYLIPETLRMTTFKSLKVGDELNIEFDSNTQIIVDTIERVFGKYLKKIVELKP